jgi:Helitron helicase-like domain at N-terminus
LIYDVVANIAYVGQSAVDRPDLVARVFYQKQQALLKKVRKGYYGKVAGLVYTIEYQKRGLPHMHLLIFLDPNHKIRTVEQVNSFISAQIPDRDVHPQLYEAVSKYMLHGPCSPERCLENGQCKKHFPKSFCGETSLKDDGYPDYARPDNARTIQKNNDVFTNKDVVPHPPQLLVEFNCHINLEVCASINSVKYIHKYIYKGHDRATLEVEGPVDEVKSYLDARYISSIEAAWRIMENEMHLEWPAVYRLPVHLPGEHMVVYDPDDNPEDVVERAAAKETHLTGWFKANADENMVAAGAHDLLYQDFPSKFVWQKVAWKIRQRGVAIGRMYSAAPGSGERFYLRLLLTVVKGMISAMIFMNQT